MKNIFFGLLLLSTPALALEVDEKLTLRVLKLSETRKTMLINRGTEDGLAEGDHAKFYVSAGVVARGVVVKVSPSRSVWSVYRLVNADFAVNDAVMSLKITPPVKVTQDETKMIIEEDTPTQVSTDAPAATLGIPLADGANDLAPGAEAGGLSASSREELESLRMLGSGNIREKNLELWAALSISSLGSSTTSDAAGASEYVGNESRTQLALNGEYYFADEKQWWSRFSPFAFVNILGRADMVYQGSKQTESMTEVGAGLNWHPWDMPSVVNDFIPFFSFSVASGRVTSSYEPGDENAGAPVAEAQGSTFGYTFGGGFKFYSAKGWGARAILDYYQRGDKMTESSSELTWTRIVSGPRLWVGLGYRW
ncbi:MAG: hypothetical protein ACLGG7_10740 [Bacteriovoracia bacterium]